MPSLQAITILRELQRRHPGRFPDSQLRTLQRHMRRWSALAGPDRDVIFRQEHPPGAQGLSGLTDAGELCVTMSGLPSHRLYQLALAHSQWEYARGRGGESFSALAEGLQNALWLIGGAPRGHRTDSLSAAFKNLSEQEDFTRAYRELCTRYGMAATRNNRGVSHENGSIESPHRHLKTALDQALTLRGSREASTQGQPSGVCRRSRRRTQCCRHRMCRSDVRRSAVAQRRTASSARRWTCVEPLFTCRQVFHRAVAADHASPQGASLRRPARLLPRLDAGAGATARAGAERRPARPRRRLSTCAAEPAAQPQALRNLVWRDVLFPRPAFRRAWDMLAERGPIKPAGPWWRCSTSPIAAAAKPRLAEHIEIALDAGNLPDPDALRAVFIRDAASIHGAAGLPTVAVTMPTALVYDVLLPGLRVEVLPC